jgi:phage terminase large subunit GpA-like protein
MKAEIEAHVETRRPQATYKDSLRRRLDGATVRPIRRSLPSERTRVWFTRLNPQQTALRASRNVLRGRWLASDGWHP